MKREPAGWKWDRARYISNSEFRRDQIRLPANLITEDEADRGKVIHLTRAALVRAGKMKESIDAPSDPKNESDRSRDKENKLPPTSANKPAGQRWRALEHSVVTPVKLRDVVVTGACLVEIKIEFDPKFKTEGLNAESWEVRSSSPKLEIKDLEVMFFSKPQKNISKLVFFWAGEGSLVSLLQFRLKGEDKWVELKAEGEADDPKQAHKDAVSVEERYMLKKSAAGDGKFFVIPGSPFAGSAGLKTTLKITPSKKQIEYAGLVFADSCQLEIYQDGTLLIDKEGIVVKDKAAKAWVSRKLTLDEKEVIALLPKR